MNCGKKSLHKNARGWPEFLCSSSPFPKELELHLTFYNFPHWCFLFPPKQLLANLRWPWCTSFWDDKEVCKKQKKVLKYLCCPYFILSWAFTLLSAGVNYVSQLLQLMHLVESSPIKRTKYFSWHSTLFPFLWSLLCNWLNSEEFFSLKSILLLLLYLSSTALWVLSQSYHSREVAPIFCNEIVPFAQVLSMSTKVRKMALLNWTEEDITDTQHQLPANKVHPLSLKILKSQSTVTLCIQYHKSTAFITAACNYQQKNRLT